MLSGVVVFVLCAFVHFRPDTPNALLATYGLVAASLLAAFGVAAAWREQLDDRPSADATKSMLEETVAHMLLGSVHAALGAVVAVVVIAVGEPPSRLSAWSWPPALGQVHVLVYASLTALTAGIGLRLAMTFVVTANLLWRGYLTAYGIGRDSTGIIERRK